MNEGASDHPLTLVSMGSAQLETCTSSGIASVGSGLRNGARCIRSSEMLAMKRQLGLFIQLPFFAGRLCISELRLVFPCKRWLRGMVVGEGKHLYSSSSSLPHGFCTSTEETQTS